jgi:Flp pilus assembly protein TadD
MNQSRTRRLFSVLPLAGLAGCGMMNLERDPKVTQAARINVAMAAEASGDTQTALQLYAAAVAKDPSDTNAVVHYARALVNSRRVGLARELLQRQLQVQRNQPALSRELGTIEVLQGNAAQAMPLFDVALASDPSDVRALVNKAIGLDMLGRHGEAQQLYARADQISPNDDAIRNNMAMSMMLAGRAAEAQQIMDRVAEGGPVAVPRIRNNMAVLAASAGDMSRARQLSNGDISETELRALAEQVRRQEAAAVAARQAPPAAAEPAPAAVPLAAPVAAAPPATPVATPAATPSDGPVPLLTPRAGHRIDGEKTPPARVAPAPAAPRDRRNMTSIDTRMVEQVQRAAEREALSMVLASLPPVAAPVRAEARSADNSVRGYSRELPGVVAAMATVPLRLRPASIVPAGNDAALPNAVPRQVRMGYAVQLGALYSAELAQWSWKRATQRMPALMQGREGRIVHFVREADGREFWRVLAAGFADRASAVRFCEDVKSQGGDCFVTRG